MVSRSDPSSVLSFFLRVSIYACAFLLLPGASPLFAQDGGELSGARPWRARADFAIPDAPAFELLAVDQSTILRPQTTREVALGLARFASESGDLALPRAVAVEFSPALLAEGSDLTPEKYERIRWLYSTRLSAAALRDSLTGACTRLSLGLRISLADERSLKTDEAYAREQQVTPLTRRILDIYSRADERAVRERPPGVAPDEVEADLTTAEVDSISAIQEEIHRRMAARYWNADIFDLAAGLRATSPDSTGRDPRLDALSVWGTYAKGIGVWGQALFGLRLTAERDPIAREYRQQSAFALRFYLGSKRAHGYAESGQTWREEERATWFTHAGFEMSAVNWAWVEFSAGVEKQGRSDSRSMTSFKLRTALPGI